MLLLIMLKSLFFYQFVLCSPFFFISNYITTGMFDLQPKKKSTKTQLMDHRRMGG